MSEDQKRAYTRPLRAWTVDRQRRATSALVRAHTSADALRARAPRTFSDRAPPRTTTSSR
jgi:hypothetical protein